MTGSDEKRSVEVPLRSGRYTVDELRQLGIAIEDSPLSGADYRFTHLLRDQMRRHFPVERWYWLFPSVVDDHHHGYKPGTTPDESSYEPLPANISARARWSHDNRNKAQTAYYFPPPRYARRGYEPYCTVCARKEIFSRIRTIWLAAILFAGLVFQAIHWLPPSYWHVLGRLAGQVFVFSAVALSVVIGIVAFTGMAYWLVRPWVLPCDD